MEKSTYIRLINLVINISWVDTFFKYVFQVTKPFLKENKK